MKLQLHEDELVIMHVDSQYEIQSSVPTINKFKTLILKVKGYREKIKNKRLHILLVMLK